MTTTTTTKRCGVLALAVCAALATGPVRAQDRAPVTECDSLAAHPADPHKVADGVQWDLLDGRVAARACEAASRLYPQSLRLRFQLARALLRAERRDDAVPLLIDVAEKGYLIAYSNLGGMYQFDLGNFAEALKWYQRGVAAGDEASQYHLAEMYMEGTGVPQNMAEAIRLFTPSAAKNTAVSLYKIGEIYTRGDHTVPRDYAKGLQFLQRAAGLGFARAQNYIGYMLEEGMGLPKNLAEAQKWYRVAAEQGWGLAQFNMGRFHEFGIGVEKNFKEAFYWYRLAANSRIPRDRDAGHAKVEALRKRIEPRDLAEVDGRINSWRELRAEETVAMLPSPVDPNYVPPVQTAQVDQSYAPPTQGAPAKSSGPAAKAAPGKKPAGEVDTAYVPPPADPAPAAKAAPAKDAAPKDLAKAGVDTAYVPPQVIEIESMDASYSVLKTANVRAMPDAGAPLVGKLESGRDVTVHGRVTGQPWLAIELDGQRAYVHASLLAEKKAPAQQVAAAPPPAPAPAAAAAAPAAAAPAPSAQDDLRAMVAGIKFGQYHALVIGNNAYQHIPKLVTPRADAKSVAELLGKEFGFKTTVLNDATRSDIIAAFAKLRATLGENDNLLIYYAGHGIVDDMTQRGYWLPVDADENVPTNWISTADITDMVRGMSAKHVMVVADSCYSGTLMRAAPARIETAREKAAWLKRAASKRARTVLSSGGMEPVMDSGGGEHSVFARAFLQTLREGDDVMDALALFETLRRPVVLNSDQTPQYADIRNAGHDGGDFIFVRSRALKK